MDERCRATNAAGSPCSARPVLPSGYCYWHCPQVAAQRAEARRKGGKGKSNANRAKRQLPAEPMTAEELHAWLGVVFKRVVAGKMEPGVGTAAANIARAMTAVAGVADFEQQLAEMRADIARFAERQGTAG